MTNNGVIALLVGYVAASHVFFLYVIHKFVNKIMSHNFHDYTYSLNAGKPHEAPKPAVPDELDDDLAGLQGFGTM